MNQSMITIVMNNLKTVFETRNCKGCSSMMINIDTLTKGINTTRRIGQLVETLNDELSLNASSKQLGGIYVAAEAEFDTVVLVNLLSVKPEHCEAGNNHFVTRLSRTEAQPQALTNLNKAALLGAVAYVMTCRNISAPAAISGTYDQELVARMMQDGVDEVVARSLLATDLAHTIE